MMEKSILFLDRVAEKKYKVVVIHDLILVALSFFQKYCNVMLLNFVQKVFYSRFYNEKKNKE